MLGRSIEWASADRAGHKASEDQLYAGVGEGQNEGPRTPRGVEAEAWSEGRRYGGSKMEEKA